MLEGQQQLQGGGVELLHSRHIKHPGLRGLGGVGQELQLVGVQAGYRTMLKSAALAGSLNPARRCGGWLA